MADPKHFLDIDLLDTETLRSILDLAVRYKAALPDHDKPLAGKALGMIFEKPSTRTRVSFERGMAQLGGDVIVLERESSHLGRGETVADTARVMSRYVDAMMIRTPDPATLSEFADHSS